MTYLFNKVLPINAEITGNNIFSDEEYLVQTVWKSYCPFLVRHLASTENRPSLLVAVSGEVNNFLASLQSAREIGEP